MLLWLLLLMQLQLQGLNVAAEAGLHALLVQQLLLQCRRLQASHTQGTTPSQQGWAPCPGPLLHKAAGSSLFRSRPKSSWTNILRVCVCPAELSLVLNRMNRRLLPPATSPPPPNTWHQQSRVRCHHPPHDHLTSADMPSISFARVLCCRCALSTLDRSSLTPASALAFLPSSSLMYCRRFMRDRCADWRLARMRFALRGSSCVVSSALLRV